MMRSAVLGDIIAGTAGAFALLRRAERPDRMEILRGAASTVDALANLPTGADELLALIPYRQIVERGFTCHDDGTPIRVLTVAERASAPVDEVVRLLPDLPADLRDQHFDVDDERYAEIVRDVLANEIGRGEGANFVVKRSIVARIENYSTAVALAAFRRLLTGESGAYWTFLVHTGDRTFLGASPEQHVTLHDGHVEMNPISGTHRYPPSGPSIAQTLRFLADQKEADELYMVVDEELKMMAGMCSPGVRLHGPRLKEMTRLAHTEYVLTGRSQRTAEDVLRATMFAPTVTGSPLVNACRVISRYEPEGRGYYSGVAALIGTDARTLDSSILIRTAEIDLTGEVRIGVGATLVRHSDPQSEVAETHAKAAALLAAFRGPQQSGSSPTPTVRVGDHPAVQRALRDRNATLARFWLDRPDVGERPELAGRRILVVDAEDAFTSMIGHLLRSLRLHTTIRRYDEWFDPSAFDLVVVGPGPGDPRDGDTPKTAALRRLVCRLFAERQPFLAVCFGHQVTSGVLGLDLVRRQEPNQGVQQEIDLFGRRTRVGFYNTFVARSAIDEFTSPVAGGVVRVSRDQRTGEVHALRGPTFASVQFHAESVLSADGVGIVGDLLSSLLREAPCPG
jgi:phenazine biosynthesis protein phzE